MLNLLGGLLLDPAGIEPLALLASDLTGEPPSFDEVAAAAKVDVLSDLMATEVHRLASVFIRVCERHRRYRDYARHELEEVLGAMLVAFPVYRTYVTEDGARSDQAYLAHIDAATTWASKDRPEIDVDLLVSSAPSCGAMPASTRAMRLAIATVGSDHTLWALRKIDNATLVHSADIFAARGGAERDRLLSRALRRQLWCLAIAAVLIIPSVLLTMIPGPNVIGYYFVARGIGHYVSWRGARARRDAEWDLRAEPALAELGGLADLPRDARASRVDADRRPPPAAEPLRLFQSRRRAGAVIISALKLRDIAERLACRLEGDGDVDIVRVAGIAQAQPGDLTFVANAKYAPQLATTRASAVIVDARQRRRAAGGMRAAARRRSVRPRLRRAVALFAPVSRPPEGVDPHELVAADAALGDGVSIGAVRQRRRRRVDRRAHGDLSAGRDCGAARGSARTASSTRRPPSASASRLAIGSRCSTAPSSAATASGSHGRRTAPT